MTNGFGCQYNADMLYFKTATAYQMTTFYIIYKLRNYHLNKYMHNKNEKTKQPFRLFYEVINYFHSSNNS